MSASPLPPSFVHLSMEVPDGLTRFRLAYDVGTAVGFSIKHGAALQLDIHHPSHFNDVLYVLNTFMSYFFNSSIINTSAINTKVSIRQALNIESVGIPLHLLMAKAKPVKIVLVDLENVELDPEAKWDHFNHYFVFAGAAQFNLKMPSHLKLNKRSRLPNNISTRERDQLFWAGARRIEKDEPIKQISINLIPISQGGQDYLDYHLCLFLGLFAQILPSQHSVTIASNDKGFNHLLEGTHRGGGYIDTNQFHPGHIPSEHYLFKK